MQNQQKDLIHSRSFEQGYSQYWPSLQIEGTTIFLGYKLLQLALTAMRGVLDLETYFHFGMDLRYGFAIALSVCGSQDRMTIDHRLKRAA
jgi:hypothetical protein